MKKKLPPLIPPDRNQCQREKMVGCWPDARHFMNIGPGKLVRCTNKPSWIAKERKPGEDGRRGSMSLCDECAKFLIEVKGKGFAILKPI